MSRFAHLLDPEQQALLNRLKQVLTEPEQERTNLVQQGQKPVELPANPEAPDA